MLDQFYSIINIENQESFVVVDLELNPDHAVYAGHFPGMPVVPGVCTLMMVKECAERLTGRKYTYRYLNSCKFLSVIRPDKCPILRLMLNCKESGENVYTLQAQLFAGDRVVLKLKANLLVC